MSSTLVSQIRKNLNDVYSLAAKVSSGVYGKSSILVIILVIKRQRSRRQKNSF